MRMLLTLVVVLTVATLFAPAGLALEKTAARFDDARPDHWSQDYTCSIAYYNTCTGWIYCWGGFEPGDMFGTWYPGPCCDPDASGSSLAATWMYFCAGAPAGYDFTGSIDIWSTDAMYCPVSLLHTQPMLPEGDWNVHAWGIQVPGPFLLTWTNGSGIGNPAGFATDHPAAGSPSGPPACGYCYPNPRTAYSFYYGTPTTTLCPGSQLDDGVCFAELIFDVSFDCVVAVEDRSWGTIKGLYR
jgi:hypothetical protein